MRIYPVQENPIGSVVSEIIRYTQTDRQTDILLLYYKKDGILIFCQTFYFDFYSIGFFGCCHSCIHVCVCVFVCVCVCVRVWDGLYLIVKSI